MLGPNAQEAGAQAPQLQAIEEDGRPYEVGALFIQYQKSLPFLPPLPEPGTAAERPTDFYTFLIDVPIRLARVESGYVAPRAGAAPFTTSLRQLSAETPVTLYRTALDAITQALADATAQNENYGWGNFYFAVATDEIDPSTGRDLRADDSLSIVLVFEGPFYQISRFELDYVPEIAGRPGLPSLDEVLTSATIRLHQTDRGYVSWRPGVEPISLSLAELEAGGPRAFSAGAVQKTIEQITAYITDEMGYMGVRVSPAPTELGPNLADLRGGRTTFRLNVLIAQVAEMRTLAAGDRLPEAERVNHPAHAWILEKSPVVGADEAEADETALLRKRALDDYLFFLSRHPGRRVDAALSPTEEVGRVTLDYIVTENNPLVVYAQASNTGTDQTETWRYRFGLLHSQVTGNDDILNVDFITADFDDNNTVFGSYDAKVLDMDRLRWRVLASWSEFAASEVGFADERFNGESWSVGGELAWNFFQDRQLFVDAVAGARYLDTTIENAFIFIEEDEQFFIPYVGLRLERYTEEAITDASVFVEWSLGDVTGVDADELSRLGRLFPDKDWAVLKWNLAQSFYLEPLFNPEGWRDVTTPETSTLAHEVGLTFRGQYAFDNRLIPQMEQVVGGAVSVRGYEESVSVGDTALIFNAEYRFHVPRAFGPAQPTQFLGKPFRAVPQHVYGKPDWDLILKGFVDVGYTANSDRFAFERDDTLVGTGVGVELVFKRNVNLRLDWGFALEEIPGQVDSGENRVHFIATILF